VGDIGRHDYRWLILKLDHVHAQRLGYSKPHDHGHERRWSGSHLDSDEYNLRATELRN
jgi:hypothetical protein